MGTVVQVTGPVVDIEFPARELPAIYNAVRVDRADGSLVVEVQQHLGNNRVRTVAMTTTDGLARGAKATDLGAPISVPVGAGTLGRVFNVLGDAIDQAGDVKADTRLPIHRSAPLAPSRSGSHQPRADRARATSTSTDPPPDRYQAR